MAAGGAVAVSSRRAGSSSSGITFQGFASVQVPFFLGHERAGPAGQTGSDKKRSTVNPNNSRCEHTNTPPIRFSTLGRPLCCKGAAIFFPDLKSGTFFFPFFARNAAKSPFARARDRGFRNAPQAEAARLLAVNRGRQEERLLVTGFLCKPFPRFVPRADAWTTAHHHGRSSLNQQQQTQHRPCAAANGAAPSIALAQAARRPGRSVLCVRLSNLMRQSAKPVVEIMGRHRKRQKTSRWSVRTHPTEPYSSSEQKRAGLNPQDGKRLNNE